MDAMNAKALASMPRAALVSLALRALSAGSGKPAAQEVAGNSEELPSPGQPALVSASPEQKLSPAGQGALPAPDSSAEFPCASTRSGQRKKGKGVDWTGVPLRHVALRVWYDGREYSGLASQGKDALTVEDVLVQAAKEAFLLPRDADLGYFRLERAGRTDKGVSGSSQVVSLYLRSSSFKDRAKGAEARRDAPPQATAHAAVGAEAGEAGELSSRQDRSSGFPPQAPWSSESMTGTGVVLPGERIPQGAPSGDAADPGAAENVEGEIDYVLALNARLPPQIRVTGWAPVPHEFSPRFSASERGYTYVFGGSSGLDLRAMLEACQLLVGEHDFRNICKPDLDAVRSFVRTILSADLYLSGRRLCLSDPRDTQLPAASDVLMLKIRGSGFLYHQIRCIASLLLHIGSGLEEPEVVRALLDVSSLPAKPDYPIAPPEQLIFDGVCYPQDLSFRLSEKAASQLTAFFEDRLAQESAMMELCAQGLRQVQVRREAAEGGFQPHALLWKTVPACRRRFASRPGPGKEGFPGGVVLPSYKRISQRPYDARLAERIARLLAGSNHDSEDTSAK